MHSIRTYLFIYIYAITYTMTMAVFKIKTVVQFVNEILSSIRTQIEFYLK